MEQVNISIPARLYVQLYSTHAEQTSAVICAALEALSGSAESTPGISVRPKPGTITGKVWAIADGIHHEKGAASREDVVQACLKEGINMNTANTQFSYWKKEMQVS